MILKIKRYLHKNKSIVGFVYKAKTKILNLIHKNKALLDALFFINDTLLSFFNKRYFSLPHKNKVKGVSNNRSIVFFGESYYHFFHLAAALRKRGWKAISVSTLPPSSLSHGSDLNLYSNDPFQFKKNVEEFLKVIVKDYKMVHFYSNLMIWNNYINNIIPLDIMSLKENGIKIGYTPSGCKDARTQTQIYKSTNGLCNKCVWQDNFQACSDEKNENLINKVKRIADFISYEADGNLGIEDNKNNHLIISTEPLLYALDPDHWQIGNPIPERYKIKRHSEKHLIVVTSFYNQHIRTNSQKDIKGMKAMYAAIEQLTEEGFPIQHIHAQAIPSKDMRYIQMQADIIIDQLNYGRYGAFAREGMMLGKPVICKIDYLSESFPNLALKECPLINADENTIYYVLKDLVNLSEQERKIIGNQSREYMLKWHSADQCAERFEKIYDILIESNIHV